MNELSELLESTAAFLRRYVVFALDEQADAAALWVGHTYVYDQFDATPYLAVQSAERRSGKTRLLECLGLLVRQPQPAAGASLAALFRIIHELHPTLLLDEADTIFNRKGSDAAEDLRGLLNNGYRRGVPFLRVVGEGKKMRVERFDVFAPKALASIRELPDTVQDRSIVIRLKRRARRERVERFRFRVAELQALAIREAWEASADALSLPAEVDVPEELNDRAADSWEPLLALAATAGGDWPHRARMAALVLSGTAEVEDEHHPIRLLASIRDIFVASDSTRLATAALLEALHADEEAPWADWRGRGLRAEGLAYLLRPFDIRSRQMKISGVKVRGFDVADFADAFDRYLPPPATTRPTRYPAPSNVDSHAQGTGLPGYGGVPGKGQEGVERVTQPALGLLNGAADPPSDSDTGDGLDALSRRYLALTGGDTVT